MEGCRANLLVAVSGANRGDDEGERPRFALHRTRERLLPRARHQMLRNRRLHLGRRLAAAPAPRAHCLRRRGGGLVEGSDCRPWRRYTLSGLRQHTHNPHPNRSRDKKKRTQRCDAEKVSSFCGRGGGWCVRILKSAYLLVQVVVNLKQYLAEQGHHPCLGACRVCRVCRPQPARRRHARHRRAAHGTAQAAQKPARFFAAAGGGTSSGLGRGGELEQLHEHGFGRARVVLCEGGGHVGSDPSAHLEPRERRSLMTK